MLLVNTAEIIIHPSSRLTHLPTPEQAGRHATFLVAREVTMWWDASLIESTVTRQFVCSHLIPQEIERLDRPLGFGDGLTNGTYWEWIEKAKRIFLILTDLGVPDQIFGIIDDSWDDDDLPIPLDQVGRLALTASRDDRVARKFYARQFHYLVHYIDKGKHVAYQDDDVVPVVVDKRPGLATGSAVDRVGLPNRPGETFSRRRFALGTGPGMMSHQSFMNEIHSAKSLQSEHLASYYGSYTHHGFAYAIFTYAGDFNLKSLLATTPPGPLKSLSKQERRRLVMNWIHCLTDTLCYIHKRGRSHGNIRPSTVLFCATGNYVVFYNNTSRLCGEASAMSASEKSVFDRESYDFAAPEQWYRPSATASHRRATTGTATTLTTTMTGQRSSSSASSSDGNTFSISRGGADASSSSASVLHTPNPLLDPQAADVFSLGCVILELISLQMKRTHRAFAAHRAARHKLAGRGGAVLDSSFHKNPGQVETWMAGLAKDAAKKTKKKTKMKKKDDEDDDDAVFRGIAPMLQVVARMLATPPQERPTAHEVEGAMYKILTETCGMAEPHCVHQYGEVEHGVGGGLGLGMGMGNLRIRAQSDDGDDNYYHSNYNDNNNFSIATTTTTRKQAGGTSLSKSMSASTSASTASRPGSRISLHSRSTGGSNSSGSGGERGNMMQDPRGSPARPSWQASTATYHHHNSQAYVMGTNSI
ncbi:protein kinase [Nemania serpens]|nr:protein kinase [Nemania serpens]